MDKHEIAIIQDKVLILKSTLTALDGLLYIAEGNGRYADRHQQQIRDLLKVAAQEALEFSNKFVEL